MLAGFILTAVALAGSAHAIPAPQAEVTTTVTVTEHTWEPWPVRCPTTVGTTTSTSTVAASTTTTIAPITTSTSTLACLFDGCGATEYPDYTRVDAVAAAITAEALEARALTTTTHKVIQMVPTCVEYVTQTAFELTTYTNPTATATATSYASTATAFVINEVCPGQQPNWHCTGSPYPVERV